MRKWNSLPPSSSLLPPVTLSLSHMKIYLIPGLAADKRVFRHIHVPDGYEQVYLEWIKPLPGENLKEYAYRMAEQISTDEPFVLAGLSFGGMLAVEIAKRFHPDKTIIIASIPHHSHLPNYYRKAWQLGMHKIITPAVIRNGVLVKRLLASESNEDKEVIKRMAMEMDVDFVKWAMQAIVEWESDEELADIIHIHGTSDRILPFSYTKPSYSIPRGGHLMIFDRAGEINSILELILKSH
jgi:pimeloyl-ACP methyl ester carboxylesterase